MTAQARLLEHQNQRRKTYRDRWLYLQDLGLTGIMSPYERRVFELWLSKANGHQIGREEYKTPQAINATLKKCRGVVAAWASSVETTRQKLREQCQPFIGFTGCDDVIPLILKTLYSELPTQR